jgi:transcriptional regulator with XRE-family HTH domain
MRSRRLAEVLRSVAANVRTLRLRRQLTQEDLAEMAEVDLRFLQKVETGRTNLSLDVLTRLAQALDVRPGRLLWSAKLPTPRPGRPPKHRSR